MRTQWTSRSGMANFLVAGLVAALCCGPVMGDYLKMNPPPDADKPGNIVPDNTCWLATGSNMLAGAGYGTGATVQARADNIYGQMVAHYGRANGGWPDTALTWWLNSGNNTWPNNTYKTVTTYGNTAKAPWLSATAPTFMGNELRNCQMGGIVIYNANIHHAITLWGDSGGEAQLTAPPAQLRVTDSDTDSGGNVQRYTWDAYSTTNGWRMNYTNPHTTLEQFISLCPTDSPTDQTNTQRVTGSYSIKNTKVLPPASGLKYKVGTDVNILTYRTRINVAANAPTITTDNPIRNLDVTWNGMTVWCNSSVTITTDFIVPTWNAISYSNVRFTYPFAPPAGSEGPAASEGEGDLLPAFRWNVQTPDLTNTDIPNIRGGFVVGSFDIFDTTGQELLGQYRFQHEYDYFQDPEYHLFELTGLDYESYEIGNFHFGHNDGVLDDESLWSFQDWMTSPEGMFLLNQSHPIDLTLDWQGRVPYNQGVPEPATLSLLAVGALAVLRRRRK